MKDITAVARKSWPYLLFASCAAIYLYPFMRILLPPTDEGTLLSGAVRVAQGQVPFRDFFEVMGPGTFYWLALFFKILGTTWFATRASVMITSLATALLMYYLARRIRTRFDWIPAVLCFATSFGYLWPAVSHHNDSNLFALLSFTIFLGWFERRKSYLLVIAGLLAGLTTCFLQPRGLLLFLSFLIALSLLCGREPTFRLLIAALSGGYLAVMMIVVLLYWHWGALPSLIYANVVWPLQNYSRVNEVPYGFGTFLFYWDRWVPALSQFSRISAWGVASLLELPFLFIVATPVLLGAFALRHRSSAFSPMILPYWLSGFALWFSELHRKDITHLVSGSFLLTILCFHLYSQYTQRAWISTLKLVSACAVSLALFNCCTVSTARIKIATRRGTVFAFRQDPVLDFLNSHVEFGQEMFVYSYSPIYYFLVAAKNPTPFSILVYGMNTGAQFHDAVRSLEARKVHYVVWDNGVDSKVYQRFFPRYRAPTGEQRVVEHYFAEHYKTIGQWDDRRVLERKSDAQQIFKSARWEHIGQASGAGSRR